MEGNHSSPEAHLKCSVAWLASGLGRRSIPGGKQATVRSCLQLMALSSSRLEVFPGEYHWQILLSLNIFVSTWMILKLSYNYWWSWQWCL